MIREKRVVAVRASSVLLLSGVLLGAALLGPGPVLAQVSEQQAAAKIAETYDVRVLRVREGEIGGTAVWLVTVMKGGGARNDAYQVTTLAVDRETGDLVPAFRHQPSGYDLPGALPRGDKAGLRPDAHRGRTWR